MADHTSKYGRLEYGSRVYSDFPYAMLAGNTTVQFLTSAGIKRSRTMKTLTNVNVAVGFPRARLSYIGYFEPSMLTVVFNTSARLIESQPMGGHLHFEFNIPNASLKLSHVLRAAFTVNTYFPLARFVQTRGYRANTPVQFDISGWLFRSGNRDFTAEMSVDFDVVAVKGLINERPFGGAFEVVFDTVSNEYMGPAWQTPPDVMPPWTPELPPDAPWIPVEGISTGWTPIEQTRYFDG